MTVEDNTSGETRRDQRPLCLHFFPENSRHLLGAGMTDNI